MAGRVQAQQQEQCLHMVSEAAQQDSLSIEVLIPLFRSFTPACTNNAEVAAWSNEVLFEVLERAPLVFLEALEVEGVHQAPVFAALSAPLLDWDIATLISRLKAISPSPARDSVIAAMQKTLRQ